MDEELNLKVAQAVGYECYMVYCTMPGGQYLSDEKYGSAMPSKSDPKPCQNYGKFCDIHIPNYSGSVEEAMEMLDENTSNFSICKGFALNGSGPIYTVSLWVQPGNPVEASHEELACAICTAVLKVETK